MKILVTGAAGFVGRYLVNDLSKTHEVITCVRKKSNQLPSTVEQVQTANFFDIKIPKDVDTIVHLAGVAHAKHDNVDEFKKINVDGTLQLARKALEANVKRFIFISSIGVNGNCTYGKAFTELETANPTNDYAVSKYEAEQSLIELFNNTSVDLVIIRPPLIYAHDAPGNFSKLLKLINTGLPLPFGCTHNKRSFIAISNLVDFIAHCVEYRSPINDTFVIADDEQVSTKKLVSLISEGMGKRSLLVPIPIFPIKLATDFLNKKALYEQLFGDLQIDNTKAKKILGWKPVTDAHNALTEVGQNYRKYHHD